MKLIELLAELEHYQWIYWSKNLAKQFEERKNPDSTQWFRNKIINWEKYWQPYALLSEKDKKLDRKWARKVLEIINPNPLMR